MNQILFTENKKKNNLQDTKKIVLFFAVTLIVFGLILAGQGIYGIYKRNIENNTDKTEEASTKIQAVQLATGEIQITVDSKVGISELIYNWNTDSSQTISEKGSTYVQELITAPSGENTLTVKTIDLNGRQITKQETFTLIMEKPDISLTLVGNNIKIIVTSKTNLSYVTYKWNSDVEQRIDMVTYEDKTKLEKEIEIPIGSNTLLVTAVDVNSNKSEKSQEIKGVTKPKSSPLIQGEYIYFEVTADEDIKQVDFTFNGEAYVIKKEIIQESNQTRKVTYRLKLKEGMNYLKIKTTTESGVTGEDIWKYEYKK